MDCKLVIDDAKKDKHNVSEYGVILPDCKTPLSHNNNYILIRLTGGPSPNTYLTKNFKIFNLVNCNI